MSGKLHQSRLSKGRQRTRDLLDGISSRVGLRGLPSQIHIMLITNLLFSFSRNLAFPYLAMYLTGKQVEGGLGIDPSLVGILIMAGGVAYTLALLVTGSLCDKFGRRKMMLAFIIPQVILTAGYAFATTFVQFFALYVIGGVLGALQDPAFSAMIADLVQPEKREEVYGLSYMIANIGTVIAPPLGGFIASSSGYPIVFIYAAILTTICAAITLFRIKESYSEHESTSVTLGQLAEVFRHRIFILFCFLGGLTNIVYTQLYGLFSVYTEFLGFEPYIFGILFSINGAMVVFLQIPIRKAAVRIGSMKAFILAQTFYAAGFTYFMVARDFIQLLVGIVILTIGEITFVPAINGFVANLSPPDKRGRYMALTGLFFGIGGSAGSLAGFWIYGILPDKTTIWGIFGILGFATLIGYIYLMKAYRKQRIS